MNTWRRKRAEYPEKAIFLKPMFWTPAEQELDSETPPFWFCQIQPAQGGKPTWQAHLQSNFPGKVYATVPVILFILGSVSAWMCIFVRLHSFVWPSPQHWWTPDPCGRRAVGGQCHV